MDGTSLKMKFTGSMHLLQQKIEIEEHHAGAQSSVIIYSIAETAKANNLKPYDYFEYLLTEIPKYMDETGNKFCERLLPWSDELPDRCRK